MRIERYYASVREEVSPLSTDALYLLANEDYIGFFKACGPTYVRSIRRLQEVSTFFIFSSTNTERSTEYANKISVSSWWSGRSNRQSSHRSKFNSESKSMRIVIKGFGMGLSEDGSEALIAQTLDDYAKVMRFAFNSMTKNKNSVHIGMVYGMEIVPWVENTAFQVGATLQDQVVEIPLLLSVIPRAYKKYSDPKDYNFVNTDRGNYRCKEIGYQIDKFGYCCEAEALFNTEKQVYETINPQTNVCKPVSKVDPVLLKENMSINGEFVARLDRATRYRLNQLATLERCISAIHAIPERYDYHILKSQDSVKFDKVIDLEFSVTELRVALDPFRDYSMVKHMAKELDEWIEMYISPCMAAMFGANVGNNPDTDVIYLMAYPWHRHKECTKLSCLGESMRWNRESEEGGCIPSMMAGQDSPGYDEKKESNCNLHIDKTGTMKCKYDSVDLKTLHSKTTKCWKSSIPKGSINYYMDHFCMPKLEKKTLTPLARNVLEESYIKGCTNLKIGSINVAKNKPASQISTWPHWGSSNRAELANDGNRDGQLANKSVCHTHRHNSPWWHVELGKTEKIKEVIVYNRQGYQSWADRASGFQVVIYKDSIKVWTSQASVTTQIPAPYKYIVPVNGIQGDAVRIVLQGDTYLNLAEVEVWNSFVTQ